MLVLRCDSVAFTMIYVPFATFFRRKDFVLHDTVYEGDVKLVHDFFSGRDSAESKG